MDNLEEYNQALADIRRDFLNTLETISDRMKMLSQEPSLCLTDSQAFSDIYTIAHNLYGSAGTFGFKAVSEAAAPLDHLLGDLERDCQGRVIGEKNLTSLRLMIAALISSVDKSLMEAGR